jgi:formylglycine-generating enzyme required for sulfatase activity
MIYDLFISHSSEDAETAAALVTDFENRQITCWIAPRDVPMGSSYQEEIVQAIENSRAILLLFSSNANKSAHVLREVELAEQGRKPILPLRIDVSDPVGGLKFMLANKQWVERKALGNRLVETIEQLLAGARPIRTGVDEARARPASPAPKKSGVSPMMIGAVAAVLLLLVGGGVAAWKGDVFGYQAAAEKERLRAEEQAKLEEQKKREQQAKQEEEKRRAEQAELERLRKQEQERKDREEQAKKEEAEKEKQRVASLQSSSLPVGASSEITIQKSAPTVETAVPGKTFFRECDICPVMAVVPAGSNVIGSPAHESGRSANESPPQPVAFRVPLAVGRSEVAFEEYIACVNEGGCPPGLPSDYDWGYGKQPAMNVSWNDAKAYVAWLSRKTGGKYRLLSEAEWEYAARGCAKVCESLPFWFGIEISRDKVNYDSRIAYLGSPRATRRERTVPIDAVSEPNPFGLLHVHGNVAEWVEDCWEESLVGMPRDGGARVGGDCSRRVVRGGSYDDPPKDVRSAKRSWQAADERRAQVGFRVARELKL